MHLSLKLNWFKTYGKVKVFDKVDTKGSKTSHCSTRLYNIHEKKMNFLDTCMIVFCYFCILQFSTLALFLCILPMAKVIYPKYSKDWPYNVAHTNQLCAEILIWNHGFNHGFFLSLLKLTDFPIHWIVCVLVYLNFIFEF